MKNPRRATCRGRWHSEILAISWENGEHASTKRDRTSTLRKPPPSTLVEWTARRVGGSPLAAGVVEGVTTNQLIGPRVSSRAGKQEGRVESRRVGPSRVDGTSDYKSPLAPRRRRHTSLVLWTVRNSLFIVIEPPPIRGRATDPQVPSSPRSPPRIVSRRVRTLGSWTWTSIRKVWKPEVASRRLNLARVLHPLLESGRRGGKKLRAKKVLPRRRINPAAPLRVLASSTILPELSSPRRRGGGYTEIQQVSRRFSRGSSSFRRWRDEIRVGALLEGTPHICWFPSRVPRVDCSSSAKRIDFSLWPVRDRRLLRETRLSISGRFACRSRSAACFLFTDNSLVRKRPYRRQRVMISRRGDQRTCVFVSLSRSPASPDINRWESSPTRIIWRVNNWNWSVIT